MQHEIGWRDADVVIVAISATRKMGIDAWGAFHEIVPVHWLAYSFGREGSEQMPPGSSLVEIDLIDRDGGSLLRLTRTGLPDAERSVLHAQGLAQYLARLTAAAAGGDPGPDHRSLKMSAR